MWILQGSPSVTGYFELCLSPGEQTSIWGLSKQGKTCKLCGLSVHSKCELKVRNPNAMCRLIADLGVRCLLTATNQEVDVCQSFLGKERHYRVRRPKVIIIVPTFSSDFLSRSLLQLPRQRNNDPLRPLYHHWPRRSPTKNLTPLLASYSISPQPPSLNLTYQVHSFTTGTDFVSY
jgi:hypothetical protein